MDEFLRRYGEIFAQHLEVETRKVLLRFYAGEAQKILNSTEDKLNSSRKIMIQVEKSRDNYREYKKKIDEKRKNGGDVPVDGMSESQWRENNNIDTVTTLSPGAIQLLEYIESYLEVTKN